MKRPQIFELLRSEDEDHVLKGLWALSGQPHGSDTPLEIWDRKSQWMKNDNWDIRERTLFCFGLRFASPDACDFWRKTLVETARSAESFLTIHALVLSIDSCCKHGWRCEDPEFHSFLNETREWLEEEGWRDAPPKPRARSGGGLSGLIATLRSGARALFQMRTRI